MAITFTDGLLGVEKVSFVMIVCYKCSVPFMVTEKHYKKLNETQETFYCPAGHPQHYTTSSCTIEKRKLQKDLEQEKQWNKSLLKQRNNLMDEVSEYKDREREARKSDCPHCGKRYVNVEQHIKNRH